jgi:hypothetical protein
VSDPLWLVFDSVPRTVARTVFYESGWSTFHWSAWLGLVVAVVIGGVLVVGMKVSLADRRQVAILATTVILGLLSVWLIAFQTSTDSARFALMSIGAFAILLALALERWRLPVRFVLPLGSSAH